MEDEVFYKDNASASTDTMGTQGSSEDNVGEEESDDDIDKMLSELQGFQEVNNIIWSLCVRHV